ncbi:helicase-exonuclease AddAB subunit AddA [Bacillus sp. DNRA2]|uniref:helicase-exonuclease AddAB subunit AddA n=1 Tax=Bacillus sp. DNRA2 TaxID=2723053 RepID=UPI00145F7C0C|nr:helicase-exonuclease AddAB subunit AddA [Bacillus sp. DNRA2]NMD70850.1 helicase-exonuclease AddAB subunit AddA [Bacillus sp. DNRA2]
MYQLVRSIIPPKPNNVTWTDDQWKAIYAKNQDILVAAAAGSGKTAVLVERMIQRILASDEPINVDELLVVTFTNASAAEMRTRIGEALEKAIQVTPTSIHLRKQLTLLNRASISTLHSFCLDVIRKYYYLIDLDPSFRIANETEVQLLRDEVMDELFEDEYGKNDNEPFFALVDAFTNDRSDDALQSIIRDVFNFSVSNPAPDLYLQSMIRMYEVDEATSIETLPFAEMILEDIELQLEGAKGLLEEGLRLTKEPGGPAPRAENFIGDIQYVEALYAAKNQSWSALYELMQKIPFARAKTVKGDEYDPELTEQAQELRKKAKKILTDLQSEFFMRKPASFLKDMVEMKPHVETIVGLVQAFALRFAALKQEKGLVDFSDLEHYCLEILTDELLADGTRLPSQAALFYKNRFKEVLVDEYQDTNMVQEAILQLVKSGDEQSGNLFMVGDVKQSIYRFRLAEPNLFLGKYRRFSVEGDDGGLRIDLAQNFRSRKEVLDGTNYLFKQMMGERVGEIDYDQAAELKLGASYPLSDPFPVELILIDQGDKANAKPSGETDDDNDQSEINEEAVFDLAELEQSQLEARVMAKKIREMIEERKPVYNPKTKQAAPVKYRDIVILLRSFGWATQIIEEFKQQGIPVYANLSSGYFEATEVSIMLSLLKVIDNPYQDIPLAAVLRSPLVGLSEAELAQIRIAKKNGAFYEALVEYSEQAPSLFVAELYEKVRMFLEQLKDWRTRARQGALSQFIWQLLKETKFYEFVGGMPGGKQRQANLRALFDRARAYEATSFRGLFRFLRFIERMRERGDDLGTARALGEQEDVVRIMTIHSSKGLEFPVVFIAGTNRNFNKNDTKKAYMLDKEFGFAAKFVDPVKRIAYPSLPQMAFKRKMKIEMLAEEMRVLYVALTRAKEKLYILGTAKNLAKLFDKWSAVTTHSDWLLPDYKRATVSTYLDWIGPALVRHQDCQSALGFFGSVSELVPKEIVAHPSSWKIKTLMAEEIAEFDVEHPKEESNLMEFVKDGTLVPISTDAAQTIAQQLSWKYPFAEATAHRAKQSVSEMKRQLELFEEGSGSELKGKFAKPLYRRPRFMQEKALTPAERGTAMHMVMQQVDLSKSINEVYLANLLEELLEHELLSLEQKEAIDIPQISAFFETELGKRMVHSKRLQRETPFSVSLPGHEVYADWQSADERVLVQGIIDCLFEDEHGRTVLVDYKTDSIETRFKGGFTEAEPILRERYRLQLELYSKAVEQILKKSIDEKYLFFFDGGHVLEM